MVKVVSPKEYLTKKQFDLVAVTLEKIEEIMCEFAMDPCIDKNGMTALSLSLTHLTMAPMIELERDFVEVFFDGLLSENMPIVYNTEECIRETVNPESLN